MDSFFVNQKRKDLVSFFAFLFRFIAESKLCKKVFQYLAALIFQHPFRYQNLMIEGRILQNIEYGAGAAGLRITTPHHYIGDPGLYDCTCVHLAGF